MKLKGLIKESSFGDLKASENDYITYEDVQNLKVGNWKSSTDNMSGSIYWYNTKEKDGEPLYATPSWEDQFGWVPFDDSDGNHYGDLDFSKNPKKFKGNKKLQIKAYLSAVKIAIKKLEMNKERELNK